MNGKYVQYIYIVIILNVVYIKYMNVNKGDG